MILNRYNEQKVALNIRTPRTPPGTPLNYNLLFTKLKAYGFSENALKLMCSYLKYRRQAVHTNNNFGSYEKIQAGVLQDLLMEHFCLTYL